MVQSIQPSQHSTTREDIDDRQRTSKDDGKSDTALRIGGPNTWLPFYVESFLGWSLCLSCLTISGYHYVKSTLISSGWTYYGLSLCRRVRRTLQGMFGGTIERGSIARLTTSGQETAWIPLTTHSRAELERQSPWERFQSLIRLFETKYPEVLTSSVEVGDDFSSSDNLANMDFADAALIRVLRHDSICRRLASLSMRPYDPSAFEELPSDENSHATTHITTLPRQLPHHRLLQRMSQHWEYFLALPSLEDVRSYRHVPSSNNIPVATSQNKIRADESNYSYRISLILPAFRESGSHLLTKLTRALKMAQNPNEVEVIVIDAGGCTDLDMFLQLSGREDVDEGSNHFWGRISIYSHVSGGGRGPCLNFGASVATGRILTFCHSDTMLPHHWDGRIVSTLECGSTHSKESSGKNIRRANSCAFSFGIDTSRQGLSMPFEKVNTLYYPPGVKAVEFTANLRTQMYSLPYGDQVLSLHACVFHFLGGFPDQCLMEDYELVSLLRHRAALLSTPSASSSDSEREKLAIIPGEPALCSPRRWQKFGGE